MLLIGNCGYDMKETGFPPRRVVPSDHLTLAAAGLAIEKRLTLQVFQTTATTVPPPTVAGGGGGPLDQKRQ